MDASREWNLQPFNILSMYYFDKINIHPQVKLKQQ